MIIQMQMNFSSGHGWQIAHDFPLFFLYPWQEKRNYIYPVLLPV